MSYSRGDGRWSSSKMLPSHVFRQRKTQRGAVRRYIWAAKNVIAEPAEPFERRFIDMAFGKRLTLTDFSDLQKCRNTDFCE